MKMRIAIREQLAALVIFAVLLALAVVSIPVWIYVNNFVVQVEKGGLALTASLKAARISSEIELVQTTCFTLASRVLVQNALTSFYNNNSSTPSDPFIGAREDLASALSSRGLSNVLQARLYSRNTTGTRFGLLNITGVDTDPIKLPGLRPNGSEIYLGDDDDEYGYPTALFPNITYIRRNNPNPYMTNTPAFSASAFPSVTLGNGSDGSGVLLGPLVVNTTFALISITVPVRMNQNTGYILGYMTLVASARTLVEVQQSREGLGETGVVLVVGSVNPWNHFEEHIAATNDTFTPPKDEFAVQPVKFLFPPQALPGQADRHSKRNFESGQFDEPFPMKQYPAVFDVFYNREDSPNNATANLGSTNEQADSIAVGIARPQTPLVTWAVVVEQDSSEASEPIRTLRSILLGCVFGTAALVMFLVFPCAHLSVMPIRRLKAATEKSIAPPGYEDDYDSFDEENPSSGGTTSGRSSEKGLIGKIKRRIRRARRARARAAAAAETTSRHFRIPARVDDRKHYITDELTELTQTFNEMTDELLKQYTSLDEKVAERTRELEISKKAAEAANESKTLFIANISHELKTPLNGIMGMCAVCMEEDDVTRIKQSLKTLYKSGDLLLHLLEDLLSFSKNQIGQQVNLEEREFRLGDIRSQVLAIFDKQVRENRIAFSVKFVGSDILDMSPSPDRTSMDKRLPALGPHGAGRLKDMCLWGDQHRILQVIINLVSNSLKFTPAGGIVDLRIRCLGEANNDESRSSSFSKTNSQNRTGRSRHRVGSGSTQSMSSKGAHSPAASNPGGTALSINPLQPKATPHVQIRERSPTPPPAHAKSFWFEFEVEDTGPGIAEHMQEKIFEPFVQGDLGLSKKYGGTGLGLSICSQLASLMGGNISLKSTVGVGTTFTMRIPLKYVMDRASSTASSSMKSRPASVSSATEVDNSHNSISNASNDVQPPKPATVLDKQPRLVGLSQPFFATTPNRPSKEDQLAAIDRAMANKPSGQGRLRVLVADDNSTNIEVVSRMLKLEDIYDVTIAKDGQEAYDLVKVNMENNQRFDVIFMDIQMPNLDGLQSTRLIRKMGYSAPIVALTAFSEESNVKECMESGMDEFLSKPIRRPALKQVLKKFATIEEEPAETGSLLTRKTTPENKEYGSNFDSNGTTQVDEHSNSPKANGVAIGHPPTPPASEKMKENTPENGSPAKNKQALN
ncbi:putative signal transduction histidine-protein kinase [Rhypophila sp. PSN 637]